MKFYQESNSIGKEEQEKLEKMCSMLYDIFKNKKKTVGSYTSL